MLNLHVTCNRLDTLHSPDSEDDVVLSSNICEVEDENVPGTAILTNTDGSDGLQS